MAFHSHIQTWMRLHVPTDSIKMSLSLLVPHHSMTDPCALDHYISSSQIQQVSGSSAIYILDGDIDAFFASASTVLGQTQLSIPASMIGEDNHVKLDDNTLQTHT